MITDLLRISRRLAMRRSDAQFLRNTMPQVECVLASFPKSGRTWLRFALSCYLDHAAHLELRPDLATTFRILPNLDRDPLRGLPGFAYLDFPSVPLIAVTHRPFERELFQDRPIIFLTRDPRDVMVSAYFHATRHKNRFRGSIHDFILDRYQGMPALLRYLDGWAGGLAGSRHHLVTYEALSQNLAEALDAIIAFLGLARDHGAVTHAVHRSSFQAMRDIEQRAGIPGHHYDRSDGESLRMRKGKAGGFQDYLSAGEIRLVDTMWAEGASAEARALFGPTWQNPIAPPSTGPASTAPAATKLSSAPPAPRDPTVVTARDPAPREVSPRLHGG